MIDVGAVIASTANTVLRRFGGYVTRDDLNSEGWLWVLEHPSRVKHYREDEDTKRADYRLRRDLSMTMEAYARREKAARLGYDPADELHYSRAQIAALLPSILRGEYEPPPSALETVSGTQDGAESGTWQAMRADVARAWDRADLTGDERGTLTAYFSAGCSTWELGEMFEVDQKTAWRRIDSGIRKIVGNLGGPKSRGCPYDCECHDAPLRVRPGTHSRISGMNQLIG